MIHGTETAYARKNCRCDLCKHHRYLLAKRARHRRAKGEILIDATEVKTHIRNLLDEGFGLHPIMDLAGLPRVNWAQFSARKRIHRSTASKLMAITRRRLLDELPDGARVPNIGARRRVQALGAIGWPADTIARSTARNLLPERRRYVTAGIHRQIAAIYRELSAMPGPSDQVRTRSKLKGWVSPFAWEDIDDPGERPATSEWKPRERRAA